MGAKRREEQGHRLSEKLKVKSWHEAKTYRVQRVPLCSKFRFYRSLGGLGWYSSLALICNECLIFTSVPTSRGFSICNAV